MDYNKAALEMHETHKGKVGIVSKVEVKTRDDLSTAYTPGVAEPWLSGKIVAADRFLIGRNGDLFVEMGRYGVRISL